MKPILTSIAASSLLAALAMAQPPRGYTVIDLGVLGTGTFDYATHITNSGLVSGHTSLAYGPHHAVLWQKGRITDIGTPGLGGQNSIAWSINERGQAVGQAETSNPDPNGEDFCGSKALGLPFFGTTCLPFLWQNDVMTPLSPLPGGNNGVANAINNRGEAAGSAENGKPDPTCPAGPQKFQFKPVIWPANGKVQELRILHDDPDGLAFGINDIGQVVGASGICTAFDVIGNTYLLPLHALLWQNDGTVKDLGAFGGAFGNSASAINNQGQVIGSSDLPGDLIFHAFLWTQATGMQHLYPLPADVYSVALAINDGGEVVGISIDQNFINLHAVLWENRVPVDLNTRILANPAGLYLQLAEGINSRGEIVGFARTSADDVHAYLATPSNGAAASESVSLASQGVTSPVAFSEDVRKLLQQRLPFGRFGARLMGPR